MRDKIEDKNIVSVPSGCELKTFRLPNGKADVGYFEIYNSIPCEITLLEIEFRSFNGYGILHNVINTVPLPP